MEKVGIDLTRKRKYIKKRNLNLKTNYKLPESSSQIEMKSNLQNINEKDIIKDIINIPNVKYTIYIPKDIKLENAIVIKFPRRISEEKHRENYLRSLSDGQKKVYSLKENFCNKRFDLLAKAPVKSLILTPIVGGITYHGLQFLTSGWENFATQILPTSILAMTVTVGAICLGPLMRYNSAKTEYEAMKEKHGDVEVFENYFYDDLNK